MKSTQIKQIWLLAIAFLLLTVGITEAQTKDKKVKPATKGTSAENIAHQLNGMSRDEKNTLSKCPVHSKQMSLSDNFRADASTSTQEEEYPFAYQLNYRRYCLACTHKMDKNDKGSSNNSTSIDKSTQCKIHNEGLISNKEYDKVDYEKKPQQDMPHAKQYLLKNYCKTCTKVYKIQLNN